mmetsp:Transcript_15934/g.40446  ORF Transcript_15934/g.40446 Transcript_15934/m.40446 type:complete len:90 (+) Transcript_15934:372-641(+)|eukprot:2066976-Prymnesium_polylepis.1
MCWQHLETVSRMREIGLAVIARDQPVASGARDFWLKFHKPPHISVEHLHLHVIAPVSTISKWDTIVRFCDEGLACDVLDVLARLRTIGG